MKNLMDIEILKRLYQHDDSKAFVYYETHFLDNGVAESVLNQKAEKLLAD